VSKFQSKEKLTI